MKTRLCAALVLAILAGCATHPIGGPAGAVPPSELKLLATGELRIPAGCQPVDGRIYRTRFVVLADGGVSRVMPDSGAGCVEDALARWVATYRYAPVPREVPTVVDWMVVTGRRGG